MWLKGDITANEEYIAERDWKDTDSREQRDGDEFGNALYPTHKDGC